MVSSQNRLLIAFPLSKRGARDWRFQPEMFRNSSSNIGVSRASADGARSTRKTRCQDGHLLPCMIGAFPGWIAAVVGRDDEKVARSHQIEQLRQSRIERFERCRLTGNIASMAVFRIEVDEIGEQQATVCE